MPPEKEQGPTLEQLEDVVSGDPGPETVREALTEALAEEGEADEDTGEKQAAEEEIAAANEDDKEKEDETPAGEEDDGKADESIKEDESASEEEAAGEKDDEEKAGPTEPPADWSAEEHKTFREMSPEQQKLVLSRVEAAEKSVSDVSESGARYAALDEVLKPHKDRWAMDGMDEAKAVNQLILIGEYARTAPTEFIKWFATNRNINLVELAGAAVKSGEGDKGDELDPYADDPVVQAMRSEMAELRQQVTELGGNVTKVVDATTQSQQAQEQAIQAQADQEINNFAFEKDAKGQAKHPYFEEVRGLMGPMMEKGLAKDLESAYAMACRAHPEVNSKIEQAKTSIAAREKEKAVREKAAKAVKTGSSIKGEGSSKGSEPGSSGNLREDLTAAFAEAGIL